MDNPVLAEVEPYAPQLPARELVEQLNHIFHEFEARFYDQRHLELAEQWPAVWQEMVAALGPPPVGGWRVLDFGCGTGFAALQLLKSVPCGGIAGLTCFDLSPAMIEQCRRKVAAQFGRASFTTHWDELERRGPFDLLATNALWHHLPDPRETLRGLQRLLGPEAVWLAGHEPSCRFYRNPACVDHLRRFQAEEKTLRASWVGRLRRAASAKAVRKLFRRAPSPKKLCAKEATRRGLFLREPPAQLIDRLVDFHVAHTTDEAAAGRGFDFYALRDQLLPEWQLMWSKTLAFMGPRFEGGLPPRWRAECKKLAQKYPDDGATFCTVWRRTGDCAA
jgi:SAM-dependent methyltransferase